MVLPAYNAILPFIIFAVVFKSASAFDHDCPPEQSRCHNNQCCKANEYCGLNSHECEPCLPRDGTEEGNFQLCLTIKNITDVATKLRHPACIAACFYEFGGKLYEDYPKKTDACNQTVNQPQTEPPDDETQESSSGLSTTIWVRIIILGVVLCLVGFCAGWFLHWRLTKYRRSTQSSSVKDNSSAFDSVTSLDDPQKNSIDIETGKKVKIRTPQNSEDNNSFDEEERLIAIESIYPQQEEPSQDLQQQADPGASGSGTFRAQATEHYQQQSARVTSGADQLDHSKPGVPQTLGAAKSNGTRLNPIFQAGDGNAKAHYS